MKQGKLTRMDIRVLIVDDTKALRDVIARHLNMEGVTIVGEASSGPEAVLRAADVTPDVVILDYMMPGQNGEDAARELRTQDPGVKIVACSGTIQSKPYWADAFVGREELAQLKQIVPQLFAGA